MRRGTLAVPPYKEIQNVCLLWLSVAVSHTIVNLETPFGPVQKRYISQVDLQVV